MFGCALHLYTKTTKTLYFKYKNYLTKMKKLHDVIIAGAGPAGAAAAITLGEMGYSVLLIDKKSFPRDKICGDGITYKALPMLQKLGVLDKVISKENFKSHGYTLIFKDNSKLSVEFHDSHKKPIYIIARHKFDNILVEKAISYPNVTFLPDTNIAKMTPEGDGIITRDGVTFRGSMIIDATGFNSILAKNNRDKKQSALAVRGYYNNVTDLNHTIELYFSDSVLPGYFWVFPTSENTANVGCGTFMNIVEEKKINLKELMHDFVKNHPIASKKFKNANLEGKLEGGKIPLAFGEFTWPRIKGNLIPIGDAGGFVNPITAEGISYAIATGIFAGEALHDYFENGNDRVQLGNFRKQWIEAFGRQYKMGDIYLEPLMPEQVRKYVMGSLDTSIERTDMASPAATYEYLVRMKVLTKSF